MTDNEKRLYEYMKYLSDTSVTALTLGRVFPTLLHFVTNVQTLTGECYRSYVKRNAARLLEAKFNKHAIIEDFLGWCGEGFLSRTVKAKRLEKLKQLPADLQERLNTFVTWLRNSYDYSEHSLKNYCDSVRMFFSYCSEFNQDNVRAFANTLYEEGKAPQTVNIRMNALIRYGESVGVPITIKRPKIQMALNMENVPSEKEVNKFQDYLKENGQMQTYLYVRILATSGCRCSEFLQLKWADILNGVVTLKCKGNKFRRIFFTKPLAAEVRDYLKQNGIDKEENVARTKFDTPLSNRAFAIRLKDLAKKSGVPKEKIYPHAFRHYFAKQYLKRRPGDIVGLAELLGHSRLDTTRVYLQKTYDEQKRNYNRTVTW